MDINLLVFLWKSSMLGINRENAIIWSHTWSWGQDPPDNLHCYWLKPPKRRLWLVETRVLRMLSCSSGALRWVAACPNTAAYNTKCTLLYSFSQIFLPVYTLILLTRKHESKRNLLSFFRFTRQNLSEVESEEVFQSHQKRERFQLQPQRP